MDGLDALWAFLVAAALAFVLTPPVAPSGAPDGSGPPAARPRSPRSARARSRRAGHPRGGGGRRPCCSCRTSGPPTASSSARWPSRSSGAGDDALPNGLPPLVKLAVQFGAAAIPVFMDVRVQNVTLPFVDPIQLGDWSYPLTLVGIVDGDEPRELHRRRRRPGGRRLHDRGGHLRGDRPVARPPGSGRSSPRSRRARPSASYGTTSTRRRSSWATPGRTSSGCYWRASRSRAS